jgi:hypothetical protein
VKKNKVVMLTRIATDARAKNYATEWGKVVSSLAAVRPN